MKQSGFTLVELAIVVVIIGLLITTVFQGQALIDSSRVDEAIKKSQDLASAVTEFKKRYRLLPGDMPSPPVQGVVAACSTGGNGNGQIDANESLCIPELLSKAGIITIDDVAGGLPIVQTYYGALSVRSTALSQTVGALGSNPFSSKHMLVTELANLTCSAAMAIDRKVDNGTLSSGIAIASVANCVSGGINDPVPLLAIAF
jgi:prepilin-type N-terminal cleavage/methylation domain-containing protein